jgi:hypothetical protein
MNYLEILEGIIVSKSQNKQRDIMNIAGLADYIENSCRKELTDNNPPYEDLWRIKLYSARYPEQSVICECGLWKSLDRSKRKFSCIYTCPFVKAAAKELYRKTCREKYGTDNVFQNSEIKDKIGQTNLRRYGSKNPMGNEEVKKKVLDSFHNRSLEEKENTRQKTVATCQEKYNVDNPMQLKEFRDRATISFHMNDIAEIICKRLATNLSKYGVEHPESLPEFREKFKKTVISKYGVEYPSQSVEVKNKIQETMIERFGSTSYLGSADWKSKRNSVMIERYGTASTSALSIPKEVRDILENKELFSELLSEYGADRLAFKLDIGRTLISRTHAKHELSIIGGRSSQAELSIVAWLKLMNIDSTANDRKILQNKELDIYIDSHKLAIEYNGLYWHSEEQGKSSNYHLTKSELCQEKGITLIHIFEDEWITSNNICKHIIKGHLGMNITPTGKSIVLETSYDEVKSFIEENSFGNPNNSEQYIAAYIGGEIFAVIGFSNCNIDIMVGKIEYCVDTIFRDIIQYYLDIYTPNFLTYLADIRRYRPSLFRYLEFDNVSRMSPKCWITDFKKRFDFVDKSEVIDIILSKKAFSEVELEKMDISSLYKILNWNKIWDCGYDVWEKARRNISPSLFCIS